MSDIEPLQLGDTITVEHVSGARRPVTFRGFYGQHLHMAYVDWGQMAGQYRVVMTTGQLTPKKASLWRVIDDDLKRLAITRTAELRSATERVRATRYGDRRSRR